ncbi:OPSV protein, partial [Steatornis caripensis]|nr:OPSV protein [Steatornis caripensis]
FTDFVFSAGTRLNAVALGVTARYRKLRQPLNYILVNVSFSGFVSCIFTVFTVFTVFGIFTVFVSSSQGNFIFGKRVCSLEGFVGATGGGWGSPAVPWGRHKGGTWVSWGTTGLSCGCHRDAMGRHKVPWGCHGGATGRGTWRGACGEPEGLQCSRGPDWYTVGTKYKSEYYTWFLFVSCFVAPLSLVAFPYSQLPSALRAGGMEKWPGQGPGPDPDAAWAQVAAQQQESAPTRKAEREVSGVVAVMVGSFCLCYAPYTALATYVVNNRDRGLDLRLVTIAAAFSKSACVCDPITYCFVNKQFRACIAQAAHGTPATDDSDTSSPAQRTEVLCASSSRVGPS